MRIRHFFLCLTLLGIVSCRSEAPPSVVIYTSVDQAFAQEILRIFEEKTGVRVQAVFDAEASKTTGFLNRLRREAKQPRCDVWWSSEIFTSAELATDGLLEQYDSPAAADIPDAWRDPEKRWTGIAARARVIAYHPDRVRAADLPSNWLELANWPDISRLALANPQFGTTRGHIGALYHHWGPDATRAYLMKLAQAGVLIADGNSQAVRMLASAEADLCATDTDDVWVAQENGDELELSYPALSDDLGPMWIPNSVALITGGPNPDTGKQLVDFLLSHEVERRLSKSDSRNVPVRAALRAEMDWEGPEPLPLDYVAIASTLSDAMRLARDILLK